MLLHSKGAHLSDDCTLCYYLHTTHFSFRNGYGRPVFCKSTLNSNRQALLCTCMRVVCYISRQVLCISAPPTTIIYGCISLGQYCNVTSWFLCSLVYFQATTTQHCIWCTVCYSWSGTYSSRHEPITVSEKLFILSIYGKPRHCIQRNTYMTIQVQVPLLVSLLLTIL